MIFRDVFYQEMETRLRDFEITLKELYHRNRHRQLEKPHHLQEIEDMLREAIAICPNEFADKLLEQRLDEDVFFSHDADAEIYHHIRYLPAYWHSHSFIEVACVLRGSCINYIANQEIVMEAGDVFIIAPGTVHAVSACSDDCMMMNFVLRTSTFEEAFFGVLSENDVLSEFFMRTLYQKNSQSYLLFRTGHDREIANYIGYAWMEFRSNRQYKSRMINSIINALFIILLRNHSTNIVLPNSHSRQEDENTIFILKYMQEHYSSISLSELATFFNYSERQIQRIIKEATGMSFSQNIQKLKLTQAVRLMQNSNLSIAAISEELGYAAPENFRHIFKKYYGMTPLEYRTSKQPPR